MNNRTKLGIELKRLEDESETLSRDIRIKTKQASNIPTSNGGEFENAAVRISCLETKLENVTKKINDIQTRLSTMQSGPAFSEEEKRKAIEALRRKTDTHTTLSQWNKTTEDKTQQDLDDRFNALKNSMPKTAVDKNINNYAAPEIKPAPASSIPIQNTPSKPLFVPMSNSIPQSNNNLPPVVHQTDTHLWVEHWVDDFDVKYIEEEMDLK